MTGCNALRQHNKVTATRAATQSDCNTGCNPLRQHRVTAAHCGCNTEKLQHVAATQKSDAEKMGWGRPDCMGLSLVAWDHPCCSRVRSSWLTSLWSDHPLVARWGHPGCSLWSNPHCVQPVGPAGMGSSWLQRGSSVLQPCVIGWGHPGCSLRSSLCCSLWSNPHCVQPVVKSCATARRIFSFLGRRVLPSPSLLSV